MALTSLAEQIAVEQLPSSPDTFFSRTLPQRMGNGAPIAYGGSTAGIAVHSACKTIDKPNFHIYSVLGAFHGPTRIDRAVICRVSRTRDTKTFATRRVVAIQEQDDGTERTCAELFVDFHVLEPNELFNYSAAPSRSYGDGPEDPVSTASNAEVIDKLVRDGHVSQAAADASKEMFAMAQAFLETRQCLSGVSGQNMMGLAKQIRTSQHKLPIPERTAAEWLRLKQPLDSEAANAAALAFIMDGALSFLPLNLDNKNFDDGGACSTLDFALRIMVPGFELHKWHMRERRTIAAAVGRTFSEGRLWDEKGTLVAVESQSCIMRPLLEHSKAKI